MLWRPLSCPENAAGDCRGTPVRDNPGARQRFGHAGARMSPLNRDAYLPPGGFWGIMGDCWYPTVPQGEQPMEVILLKEIKRLGKPGETKRVAGGYARNYLIPRGLAVPATAAARRREAERAAAQARRQANEKVVTKARVLDLQTVELVFKVKAGESGRLYGSITPADIADGLAERIGEEVDRRKVLLEGPIKEIGTSEVEVRLYPEATIRVTVIVEPEEPV